MASIAFLGVVGVVYDQSVLDYAVLENVSIKKDAETNKVYFRYDVIKPGRIDFIYGNAILTDRKNVQKNEGFEWSWTAQGLTEIKVRSQQWGFPHWDEEAFRF